MAISRFYKLVSRPAPIKWNNTEIQDRLETVTVELCYYVETAAESDPLTQDEVATLVWLFKDPQQEARAVSQTSQLEQVPNSIVIEIGPRFNFSTASSTNSVSIMQNVSIVKVVRIEKTTRYLLQFKTGVAAPPVDETHLEQQLMDRMTECRYTEANIPRASFNESLIQRAAGVARDWYTVPVIRDGRRALQELDAKLGLAFDDWDLDYYTTLFRDKLKRDPTTVEIFDCAQSNSEHSRHWFFKGRMIVDGVELPESLIDMIVATQQRSHQNNTIKFSDNSSAIKGYRLQMLRPEQDVNGASSSHAMGRVPIYMDLIFTAETHNMPTAVEPFSGATTGTGGRIRDVQAVGRGGLVVAGTAGYCVGYLNIPGYELPYEVEGLSYPASFADPLKIMIRASDGASDYGNKFGEPVIAGFAMSYGWTGPAEREEYVKPIMFSAGMGLMDASMRDKFEPQKGYLLAKLGGPVYRIGVGGGAASSVVVQGTNDAALDFNAVQRGDPEMENKLNRVIRACIELGARNPIVAIHDQGAGGNGNVLKELVEKTGARIFTKQFMLGDPTITTLELWGAEYQETNAIVCRAEDRELLERICGRERCPVNFVGVVTDDGYVTLIEGHMDGSGGSDQVDHQHEHPFHMHLDDILGKMPRKEYNLTLEEKQLTDLTIPTPFDWTQGLRTLLSVLSVGSKRFLTNKVDRSVTGLIAQQQCVGPLQTPLADYALCAGSYFGKEGVATSIGAQPLKGMINPQAGARMSVAEALSNLVFVKISALGDVKCSGNWMWPAKLPGEGAKLVTTCQAMCDMMGELGIAVDGGKDSLSMATLVPGGGVVKSPDTLVISTYAPCPDVTVRVTPDLKMPAHNNGVGELIWVNIENKFRLGGSAFAQSLHQQGATCPDVERVDRLKTAFNVTQELLQRRLLLAGHDISEGGLLVCLLEMAFGGTCGLNVDIPDLGCSALEVLLAEEAGWVMEVHPKHMIEVMSDFKAQSIPVYHIGQSKGPGLRSSTTIKYNGKPIVTSTTLELLKQWERTSFEIEKLQVGAACATEEYESLDYRTGPQYKCTFDPDWIHATTARIRVAVVREEGVNGDREMIATLMNANFEVHDVTMWDLVNGKTALDNYRGVVFPGGFSYADTLGSAKGWAATIKFNPTLLQQFQHFRHREDTFSIGVCNGCQLMGFLGWIGTSSDENCEEVPEISLLHNRSGRYESRWSSVRIEEPTNSILLKRMQGSVLGCWIAHGEGQFSFRDGDKMVKALRDAHCIAMTFVDDNNEPTERYPMNPNGTKDGIAALSSPDGRHLALMPHPERCSIMWQWPYIPHDFQYKKSPWQTLFDEAQIWCSQ